MLSSSFAHVLIIRESARARIILPLPHASFPGHEECAEARAEGRLLTEPNDSGYPVGYWALLSDPDGHTLELSHGQEVGLTVGRAGDG